jgi:putative addiction module antidote
VAAQAIKACAALLSRKNKGLWCCLILMKPSEFARSYNISYYFGDIPMLAKLKVVQIGNSLGATFSKELTAHLKVDKGDTLFLTEAPGGYLLTPYDPEFETQMTLARKIMKKRRNALRELAK